MTPAADKLNGHGLNNTACHEPLPKKTKVMQYWLQKDYQQVGMFYYKSEWANA